MTETYTPTFTVDDVVSEVRKLAEERPDFIYGEQEGADGRCSYVAAKIGGTEGEGCIVGQALARLGVPLEMLEALEYRNANDVVGAILPLSTAGPVSRLHWLNGVQAGQDTGKPWGEAVADAGAWHD